MHELRNTSGPPYDALGTAPEAWLTGFATLSASLIAKGDVLPPASLSLRSDGQTLSTLTVVPAPQLGWSVLWSRSAWAGGGEWVSVRDPAAMTEWYQDEQLAIVPRGSLVEVLTAARLIASYLTDPSGAPPGPDWTDSTALPWPERI